MDKATSQRRNVAYERSFAELFNGHKFSIVRVFTLAKNHQNKLFRFFLCYCYDREEKHLYSVDWKSVIAVIALEGWTDKLISLFLSIALSDSLYLCSISIIILELFF